MAKNNGNKTVADWNHNFHPKDRLIDGSPLERGLRGVRVEWVSRRDHDRYHKEYAGPSLGEGIELVRPLIFAAAGFIPEHGLTYDHGRHAAKVRIKPEHRIHLWQSGRVKIEEFVLVRDALIDFGLQNGLPGLNMREIKRFLSEKDMARRFERGMGLLGIALQESLPGVTAQYDAMLRQNQLPPGAPVSVGGLALTLAARTSPEHTVTTLERHLLEAA
jgi:hypothetical protein